MGKKTEQQTTPEPETAATNVETEDEFEEACRQLTVKLPISLYTRLKHHVVSLGPGMNLRKLVKEIFEEYLSVMDENAASE